MDSSHGDVVNKLRLQLKMKKKVLLNACDFNLENLVISNDLLLDNLVVKGITIKTGDTEAEVNVDEWL